VTDTNKEKVATLTGSLLARKGGATPAGFTRAVPYESETTDPQSVASRPIDARKEADSDQPSLDLGPAFLSKSGGAEEGWAPLSQIAIRPHPFQSEESKPAGAADPTPALVPSRDVGLEPTLSMDSAQSLPAMPVLGKSDRDATAEKPPEPPERYPREPILVMPLALRKAGAGERDADAASDDVRGGEFEALAAPKPDQLAGDSLAPGAEPPPVAEAGNGLGADAKDRPEEGEGILAAVLSSMDGQDGPPVNETPPKETPVTEPPEPVAAAGRSGDPRLDGGVGVGAVRLKRPAARSSEVKAGAAQPIRIGDLQARARVISGRSRRRSRKAPVIWAVVALAVFLGVTWQVYRINRDSGGGLVSSVGANGEPTIWATVDELGYAVSQIVLALTGGGGSGGEDDATLAAGANDVIVPTPNFVPVGPIGAEPDGPGASGLAVAPLDAPDAQDGEAVAEVTPPKPQQILPPPTVEVAQEIAPAADPLPAPEVPAAPVVAASEDTPIPATPRPVGVTAPPAPPLSVDIAAPAAAVAVEATAPQVREEVDTAISLEPLAPATIAVAAGGEGAASVGDETEPVGATEVASLPPSDVGPPVTGAVVAGSAGVPVLKPTARLAQQSLGGLAAGESREVAAVESDGYAVQLSSLKTQAQAEREFERLKGNYPALLREIELVVREGSVSNRGTFFRVLTSRFDDAGAAQALCRSLRERGQDCLVVRR